MSKKLQHDTYHQTIFECVLWLHHE
jgi:hypothetical protein